MSLTELPDWVTSDSHWNHANISKYCARTTPSVPTPEAIDELMRINWHALVRPDQTILHLGDLGWFKGDQEYDWLRELPGCKLFVRGNHDHKLSTEWLDQHGFKEIQAPTYQYEGVDITCTHYPQKTLAPNEVNMAGHVHNNPTAMTPRHLNVSVELWHYAPIPFKFGADKLVHGLKRGRVSNADFGPRNVQRKAKRKSK